MRNRSIDHNKFSCKTIRKVFKHQLSKKDVFSNLLLNYINPIFNPLMKFNAWYNYQV